MKTILSINYNIITLTAAGSPPVESRPMAKTMALLPWQPDGTDELDLFSPIHFHKMYNVESKTGQEEDQPKDGQIASKI